jgi:hypothetical protein
MKSADGTLLSADEIRVDLAQGGSKVAGIVLTGHVDALLQQTAPDRSRRDNNRTIEVTTEKAVYDPTTNAIEMPGKVTETVTSNMTEGPFVQTGSSGEIQLGKAPDYPKVLLNDVHATFTPRQQ